MGSDMSMPVEEEAAKTVEIGIALGFEFSEVEDEELASTMLKILLDKLKELRGRIEKCLVAVLRIGVVCSLEMTDVMAKLSVIREKFLETPCL
ncbi:hypothetical protein EZV62_002917 [Acer yangbiense]|uniref:Uncharacterized protein n=1 Tax=Acer yangbiense TaxID=1000413 RepID=A0A5C7IYY3_9ROSI|nr:hypothetical protein EZV62_002917 [Acer yangbiense]